MSVPLPPPRTADRDLDLIAVGECMVELSSAAPLSRADRLDVAYAGDTLNSLTVASRLGARTGFVTRVGDDPFTARMLAAWQADGIDTAAVGRAAAGNGVYFISVDEYGEREFTYRRAGSAASTLAPEDIRPGYVARARTVLLSGITQAISPTARAATLRTAELARAAGTLIAYDPNWRPALWEPFGGLAAAREAAAELLPYVDVLLPSAPADVAVLGHRNAPRDAEGAEAARLLGPLAPLTAVTCGADGVWLGTGEHVIGRPADEVRDTSGAGDAWNAAFLVGLLQGAQPRQAAEQANVLAARTVAHRGAIPPREAELPWPTAGTPHPCV